MTDKMNIKDMEELSRLLTQAWVLASDSADLKKCLEQQREDLKKIRDKINVYAAMTDFFYKKNKLLPCTLENLTDMIDEFDSVRHWGKFQDLSYELDIANEFLKSEIEKIEYKK